MRANEGNSYGYMTNRVGGECQGLKKKTAIHNAPTNVRLQGGGHKQGISP